MEEHTLQPGAEEQKKPQNTIDETSEEAQTKEEVVPIESPAKSLDKSKIYLAKKIPLIVPLKTHEPSS